MRNSREAINVLHAPAPVELIELKSVQQTRPSGRVSDKYKFIPTMQAVQVIQDMGWVPVSALERGSRLDNKAGFQKHIIRFRESSSHLVPAVPGEIFVEIILINSHNGGAAFQIKLGLFRVICCNGMAVSDCLFETIRVRHVGYQNVQIENAVHQLTESTPRIAERIREFNDIELSPDERGMFVQQALKVRYGEEDFLKRNFMPEKVLEPRRKEDQRTDLFTTLNIVQEKLITGKDPIEYKRDKFGIDRIIKTKPIKSLDENVRINQGLWQLAEQVAAVRTMWN